MVGTRDWQPIKGEFTSLTGNELAAGDTALGELVSLTGEEFTNILSGKSELVKFARIVNAVLENMESQLDIPDAGEVKGMKLVSFNIKKLDEKNVKNWKFQIKSFLELQDCWDIVELTTENS